MRVRGELQAPAKEPSVSNEQEAGWAPKQVSTLSGKWINPLSLPGIEL